MNNEPVAWMYESKNVDGKPYISDVSLKPLFGLVTRYGYKEIPLYTHPVKELTDEDYKEALACLQFALNDTMDYLTLNNLGGENNHWLVWARAILRKAQEK
jgi:hypothetical protein